MTLIDIFIWTIGIAVFLTITAGPLAVLLVSAHCFAVRNIGEGVISLVLGLLLSFAYIIGLAEFSEATGIGPEWIKKPEWVEGE
ncbi:hypothetical protein ACFP47_09315 [Nesterenkonia lacusekhoensis]|uniref:Uncharacterized protein n=1 Tax=Nesterenkonia lacusekhoensis TaxID=150832 RepID=A0ABS4SYW5_9MICC|nr:hypothetical protein [Nesterenkonia lacusekhoensis]MBP2317386.1 hypothetical protein [Nesterenkonia lacusekhoensis]